MCLQHIVKTPSASPILPCSRQLYLTYSCASQETHGSHICSALGTFLHCITPHHIASKVHQLRLSGSANHWCADDAHPAKVLSAMTTPCGLPVAAAIDKLRCQIITKLAGPATAWNMSLIAMMYSTMKEGCCRRSYHSLHLMCS